MKVKIPMEVKMPNGPTTTTTAILRMNTGTTIDFVRWIEQCDKDDAMKKIREILVGDESQTQNKEF
ncbi:hypothetical protein [Candidatus Azobacteroides pseudotrichonymphae]|uniref:hypothetical protein n=1 Tax=Candidatus Azobacteroides pseudotrichonymphae TaxID=511435 RepID=UPI0005A27A35|nr:hypothetical protein [Candidatus Azobacteroides pseudotrichonymphae]